MITVDYRYTVDSKGHNEIRTDRDGDPMGVVVLPEGMVRVSSWGGGVPGSKLNFVYKGYWYLRCFSVKYTARGLVTKAKQFVKDVVAKEAEGED